MGLTYKIKFETKKLVYRDCDGGVDQVVPSEWRELAPSYDVDTAIDVCVALRNIGVSARIIQEES